MGFGEILREFGVKVNLGFDGKQVDQAQTKIEKFADKLKGFALEASAVTAGLFAIQNGFTSNSRALTNQASLLGISTEELQANEYAAKVLADVNRDELVGSLQQLGNTMDQARAGSVDARRTLEQLGGMSGKVGLIINRLNDPTYKVTEAFHDMASGIQAIAKNSPLAASRIVEQTLGSAKLLNVLKHGPSVLNENLEIGRKQFALNDQMIKQGNEMDIQMSRLWLTFRKFGYEIGFSVMKHMGPMINAFTKWFAVNKKVIASGLNAFLNTLADVMKVVWQDVLLLSKALGPLVDGLGGMQKAVNLLIAAWLGWKAIGIATSFISMSSAILKMLPALGSMAGAFWGVAKAFKAFALIQGVADLLPALQLFGTGALAALSPLMPVLLALGAAAFALHEIMALMNGDETWTEQGFEKVKQLGSSLKGAFSAASQPGNAGSVFGMAKGGIPDDSYAPAGPVNQENHFHTNNTITVPPGTTSSAASHMISNANITSHEGMMKKAKLDAARRRKY